MTRWPSLALQRVSHTRGHLLTRLDTRFLTSSALPRSRVTFEDEAKRKAAQATLDRRRGPPDLKDFPPERIRNFAIIAHIDAGKSTLSDRLLEATGTIETSGNKQILDKLKVERERGITVKANTASMKYHHLASGQDYLLNLIDTPGHVDFASEVHRSLLACQGALLLIDATQGIQSQTLAVFNAARNQANIRHIIGVLNKCDLPHAEPDVASAEVAELLQSNQAGDDNIRISAKTGDNITAVLDAIVERIPPPLASPAKPFRAMIFDSTYDAHRGVVSLIAVLDGRIARGDKIAFHSLPARQPFDVADVGILFPDHISLPSGLRAGQVGYLCCGIRNEADVQIGDIVHAPGLTGVQAIADFKPLRAVVFASFHPVDAGGFPALEDAVKRLMLTDRSIACERETSIALGQGFRLGFLGALHMDVAKQRLLDEYDADVLVTRPFVPVRAVRADGTIDEIVTPQDWPDLADFARSLPRHILRIEEPVVEVVVNVPESYVSPVMQLCLSCRGKQTGYVMPPVSPVVVNGQTTAMVTLTYIMPLSALVTTFHAQLQANASGYASFTYTDAGFQAADLVKLVLLLQGDPIEPLSNVVHRGDANKEAHRMIARVKAVLDRMQVPIRIQAAVEGKTIAKDNISPYKATVLQGITGLSRKMKHKNIQKKGQAELRAHTHISLSPEKYDQILSDDYLGTAPPAPKVFKGQKMKMKTGRKRG